MFEKKKHTNETSEPVPEQTNEDIITEVSDPVAATDCDLFSNASVRIGKADVTITIPVGESVVSIKAPQQLIARLTTETIAGPLLASTA